MILGLGNRNDSLVIMIGLTRQDLEHMLAGHEIEIAKSAVNKPWPEALNLVLLGGENDADILAHVQTITGASDVDLARRIIDGSQVIEA